VRLLWLLPKAAPVLLRHFVAYAELAGLDLAKTQRDVASQLLATALIIMGTFFAVFMGCLLVVAYTWDTPHRIAAIAWMGGGFLFIVVVAALFRSNISRTQSPFLSSVRREWQEDRVILERILSSDED
jgi:uncharacterized membrane protein YqjE